MRATWFNLQQVLVGVAIWMAGAVPTAVAASAVEPAAIDTTGKPLAVDNPYTTQGPLAPARKAAASPVDVPPAQRSVGGVPFVGAAVDSNAPVIYRLPNVSLFVPIPVDTAASARPWKMLPPSSATDEKLHSTSSEPARAAIEKEGGPDTDKLQKSERTESHLKSPLPVPHRDRARDNETASRPSEKSFANATAKSLPLAPRPIAHDSLPFEPPQQTTGAGARAGATGELTPQLLPAVQRGYGLAQRGALFAAQTEFVQVLRRIAQAKDAASRSGDHSRALAAGLRAIDEAEDFVPPGIQLEADIDVPIVASSHRTPALYDYPEEVLPHQAAVLYHRYAEEQLAIAVFGEQAGSMALHGLGKIHALRAARNDDDMQLTQRAMAMYSAALGARPDNHLAANELGVLLCRDGRTEEAVALFVRTIDAAPSSLAYHNLAVAQRKLGLPAQAAANEQESQRLAAWERSTGAVSRREGVTWVSSQDMTRVAQPAPLAPAISTAAQPSPAQSTTMPPAPNRSTWQRTVEFAKNLRTPGENPNQRMRHQESEMRVARPVVSPSMPSQARWR